MLIRPFTRPEAEAASTWRYEGALAMYNGEPGDVDVFLTNDESGEGYYVIEQAGEMVGFCCYGPEATVPGQVAPALGMVDVGISIRPDSLERGLGTQALPAVMQFARETFGARSIRVVVASFNARSLALFRRAGFEGNGTIEGRGGVRFMELVRQAE